MTRSIFVGISAIFALIMIAVPFAYAQVDKEIIIACEDVKNAMLDPNLPTSDYNNQLKWYNDRCANITGELPPK
jgi:hypothetical protein